MQHILNTADSRYTTACIFPVVQQVVGGFTAVRHIIGLIKDLATMILFCSGPEDLNNYLDSKMRQMDSLKEDLKTVKEVIELAQKTSIATLSTDGSKEYFKKTNQNFDEFRKIYDLQPLDRLGEACCMSGEPDSLTEFLGNATRLQLQLQDKEYEYNKVYLLLWACKAEPPLERLHNIAIGAISATPVVGTIYNLASRYYIQNVMNTNEIPV